MPLRVDFRAELAIGRHALHPGRVPEIAEWICDLPRPGTFRAGGSFSDCFEVRRSPLFCTLMGVKRVQHPHRDSAFNLANP
ncbi:MAG TPA: hypothetical protein VG225_07070 [Terracidiphilus sp.]|nr:hypothetical protein [Terracidiphilus sp.]